MWSGTCLTSKLYDKIIKITSKSHETFPLYHRIGPNQIKIRQPFFNFENRPSHRYNFFMWGGSWCKMVSADLPDPAATSPQI
jgi:hypothetical protein